MSNDKPILSVLIGTTCLLTVLSVNAGAIRFDRPIIIRDEHGQPIPPRHRDEHGQLIPPMRSYRDMRRVTPSYILHNGTIYYPAETIKRRK